MKTVISRIDADFWYKHRTAFDESLGTGGFAVTCEEPLGRWLLACQRPSVVFDYYMAPSMGDVDSPNDAVRENISAPVSSRSDAASRSHIGRPWSSPAYVKNVRQF